VLDDTVAVLTEASPREFAGGILRLLADPTLGLGLSARAQALATAKYSYESYLELTRDVVARVSDAPRPQAARSVA
jgi:hypothetical protein